MGYTFFENNCPDLDGYSSKYLRTMGFWLSFHIHTSIKNINTLYMCDAFIFLSLEKPSTPLDRRDSDASEGGSKLSPSPALKPAENDDVSNASVEGELQQICGFFVRIPKKGTTHFVTLHHLLSSHPWESF